MSIQQITAEKTLTERLPVNARPSLICCAVCDTPYIIGKNTCALCGATGKQRTGKRTA